MKKINILSLLLIVVVTSQIIYPQVTQEWVTRYNGPGNSGDEGFSIGLDNLGNVIVAGTSNDTLVTIKYKNNGQQVWVSKFKNAFFMMRTKSLAIDDEGSIYINATGRTNVTDIFTIKYNSQGVQQWVSTYSSPGESFDWSGKIEIGKDGFVYVLGRISPIAYAFEYLAIKYNPSSGDTIWTRIFDQGGYPFDMVLDNRCNVYITGSSFRTIKYNSDGKLLWVSSPVTGESHAIAIDKKFNVYVTGEIYGNTEMDCKTIKYDSNGIAQWIRTYNNNHWDDAFSIAVDDSSNVLVAGYSEDIDHNNEYNVIKYNTNGIQQWVSRYIGVNYHNDELTKIIVDKFGNSYVTGYTNFSGPYHSQYTTIKYSITGIQLWVQHYRNLSYGNDGGNDLVLDTIGNVYVTGSSYNGSNYDIATIKYSQPNGIHSISSEISGTFSLSQNYPNPFNPGTMIKFDIPMDSRLRGNDNVVLVIYDVLGHEITTLVNEQLKPGTYEVEWDARQGGSSSELSSGVYYYQLVSGDYVETKKMVLVK
jgi:hypothetical protein